MTIASEKSRPGGWTTWLGLLVVAGVVLLLFSRVAGFEFLTWDDDRALTKNPYVQGLTLTNIQWMFTNASYNGMYEPLGWLSYAVVYEFWGLNPRAHHVADLLMHLLNALLVFLVLRELLVRVWDRSRGQIINLAATFGALLWAVHPLRTEVVGWVGAQVHSLAGMFLLGSLWCYLRTVRRDALVIKRPLLWLSVVLFATSLICYPVGLMLPAALVVVDVYVLRRLDGAAWWKRWGWLAIEKAPYAMVLAIGAAVSIWGRYHEKLLHPTHSIERFPLASRLMQAPYVWMRYLWLTIFPSGLSPFYTRLRVGFDPWQPVFIVSLCVLITVTVGLFFLKRRYPVLWAAWLCHLIFVVPFLGVSQNPFSPSDRYTYLESVIWSALLAGAIVMARERGYSPALRRACVVAATLVVLVYAALGSRQLETWGDNERFFAHMTSTMDSERDRAGVIWRLGSYYLDCGRYEEAIVACDRTLKELPQHQDANHVKCVTMVDLADRERQSHPMDGAADKLYADAARACDNWSGFDEGAASWMLGGYAHAQLGQLSEAEARLKQAVERSPQDPQVHLILGEILWQEEHTEEARKELDAAIGLSPALQMSRVSILQGWVEKAAQLQRRHRSEAGL